MKLPPQQLQEEGIFDFIGNAIKTIAPIAMKVAPMVAGVVSSVINPESTVAGESNTHEAARPASAAVMPRGLSEKRSLLSLRDVSTRGNEGRNRSEKPVGRAAPYAPYTRLGTQLPY